MGVVEVLDPVQPMGAGGWKVDVSRGERNGRVSSEWFNRPDDERYLSLDDLWASVKGRAERSRSRVVQTADTAVGDQIVSLSDDRLAGLEQLRSKIGSVSTQKEVDALNARIAVEQAMLQNDTNRIQGLAMLQQAQAKVEEQRQTEVAAQRRAKESAAFTSIYGDDSF